MPKLPTRYRLDLPALITNLLPAILRRPRHIAWLLALLSPVIKLYEQFTAYYFLARRELSYNGQTMMMERALNDRFDPAFRRIRIVNADTQFDQTYFNFVREQQPWKYAHLEREDEPPLYMHRYSEFVNQTGFTVRCPLNLATQQTALHTRIRQLKIALVKYQLLFVQNP